MKRRLGMYSPEIKRDSIEEFFEAAAQYGFSEMQFDFRTACGETLPEAVSPALVQRIRRAADASAITIRALNGTFNLLDAAALEENLLRFRKICRLSADLGCGIVTLCTGTRNPESMWRPHPDNDTPRAWQDMLAAARRLKPIAEECGVVLGVETEASNVVNTPERALALLEEMQSDRFGIIFDPANLFHAGEAQPERAQGILNHAFEILKNRIILAHAKDICAGDGIAFTSAGQGIVPFAPFFALLDSIGYTGPVIAHGIHDEAEFPAAVRHLNSLM